MKKPAVDYTKLRFNNINSPEYRHVWLLLGWVWYLTMYVLTEMFVPIERCHEVHSIVDDIVPFNEYFVLAYYSWYLLMVGSLLYFLLYDPKSFTKVQIFIIATQVIGIATYIIWPSVQYLRPAQFEHDNFCTFLLGMIYKIDTPTGVCPSLHVGYSLAMLSIWLKKKDIKVIWKVIMTIWILLICASVLFVKQHSFTDVWAATVMCLLIEIVMFGKDYWRFFFKKEEK